uniref:Uncharacterized protein n=1 Tax=Sus scrofa TaxID=9823 RepID=A0A8D1E3S3_PIG
SIFYYLEYFYCTKNFLIPHCCVCVKPHYCVNIYGYCRARCYILE